MARAFAGIVNPRTLRLINWRLASGIATPPAIAWISWTLKPLPRMKMDESAPSCGGSPYQASRRGARPAAFELKISEPSRLPSKGSVIEWLLHRQEVLEL